jgi:hypothetical protein
MAIQNYTLAAFLTETKTRLNEASNDGLWSTPELTIYINHALLRIVLDSRILEADTPINVAANVAIYTFPTNMLTPLWIYGPQLWGSLRLFPSFLLSLDKQYGGMYQWEKDSSNWSQGFVPFSYNQFILWPAPSTATTVTLHYVPIPTPLVYTSDTTNLPLVAQRTIPIFASYLALLKSDMQKATNFKKEYKQRLVSVLELTRHQLQDRPTVMVPARGFDRSMANPSIRAYRNSRRYYG